jgi:hypothetical protein
MKKVRDARHRQRWPLVTHLLEAMRETSYVSPHFSRLTIILLESTLTNLALLALKSASPKYFEREATSWKLGKPLYGSQEIEPL